MKINRIVIELYNGKSNYQYRITAPIILCCGLEVPVATFPIMRMIGGETDLIIMLVIVVVRMMLVRAILTAVFIVREVQMDVGTMVAGMAMIDSPACTGSAGRV